MKKLVLVFVALSIAFMSIIVGVAVPADAVVGSSDGIAVPVAMPGDAIDSGGGSDVEQLLQFTAGGHVLGFDSRGVYLAGLDHALRVEFSGGTPVQPVAEAGGTAQNGAAPLGSVTYSNTWSNIDVVYSAVDGGIAESTYIIHPGGDPDDISLRYNVPVEVMPGSGLSFTFESGYMTEGAPVAWQLIDGQRLPVAVQFQRQAEDRVGFSMGSYNAGHTVYIDPVHQWHTFYGSSNSDYGNGIAVGPSGNVYVAGESYATWNGPGNTPPSTLMGVVAILILSSSS
jgi:hypothetical protein